MPPERWDRVQSVFLLLADLPANKQAEQLASVCGDDGELRAEVQSLLDSDRQNTNRISGAIANEAALFAASEVLRVTGSDPGAW